MSVLGLVPSPPGRIVTGSIRFQGREPVGLGEPEMRKVCGNEISMIFQEPTTSLNPVLRIGRAVACHLRQPALLEPAAPGVGAAK